MYAREYMNTFDELYFFYDGRLYTASEWDSILARHPGVISTAIPILFPAASYNRVLDERGMELFPIHGNPWLFGQECPCGRFQIGPHKRPASIREHIIYCIIRHQILGQSDPIKRLCECWSGM